MKTVLFIHGGKVTGKSPSPRFSLRLDRAIEYYREHQATEDMVFLVSGRWGRVTDNFLMTEAEVGKRYILQQLPDVMVVKEDISVEIIGNYAFSKPLIKLLKADQLIIFTSELLENRVRHIAQRVFANEVACTFYPIKDEFSENPILLEKEVQATKLFRKLFADVANGDDITFREKLLYETPYYFKGIIDDKAFFDTYWEGGFDHYLNGIRIRNNT